MQKVIDDLKVIVLISQNMNGDSSNRADKIVRRRKIAAITGGCDRCPPHAKENVHLKGHKPRDDRHKNHPQSENSQMERASFRAGLLKVTNNEWTK